MSGDGSSSSRSRGRGGGRCNRSVVTCPAARHRSVTVSAQLRGHDVVKQSRRYRR